MKMILLILALALLFTLSIAKAEDCQKAVELYNKATSSRSLPEKERLFKEALTLPCSDKWTVSRIHNNLADTYESGNRFEEAIKEYKKAISANPDLATPYIGLGDVYSKLRDRKSAGIYYDKYYRFNALKTKDRIRAALSLRNVTRAVRAVPSEDLYFGFDQFILNAESERQLEELLSALNEEEFRSYRFQLMGHTCNIGSDGYNQKLSETRAEAVKKWLVAQGYPAVQLQTTGFGKKNSVADNGVEEGRKLNRRVEIRTAGLIVTDIARSIQNQEGIHLLEQGQALMDEGKYQEAASLYEKGLVLLREDRFRVGARTALGNLYLIYQSLGDDEKAHRCLREFLEIEKR